MDILGKIKHVFAPRSYPETEFGLEPMAFFLALLRICLPAPKNSIHIPGGKPRPAPFDRDSARPKQWRQMWWRLG